MYKYRYKNKNLKMETNYFQKKRDTEFMKSCTQRSEIKQNIIPQLIEPFDGIIKNNARKIFGILLIIIIINFAIDIFLT